MISVIVYNRIQEENQARFLEYAKKHRAATKEFDKGCILFEVCAPQQENILFLEVWETKESLSEHMTAASAREHLSVMNALNEEKKIEVYDILE